MNEVMRWEDWIEGRRAPPEQFQRPRGLRRLFNGERGLPFQRTEDL